MNLGMLFSCTLRNGWARKLARQAFALILLATLANTLVAQDIGFEGPSFSGAGAGTTPTEAKPQSKVWFNDGIWWGSLWSNSGAAFRIHRLDFIAHTWVDTGVAIDTRANSHSDALWDGTKLYVATHLFSASGEVAGNPMRVLRFSYNAGTDAYSLDAGFPVTVGDVSTEALTIAKDSTSRVWVAWTQALRIRITHTLAADTAWSAPVILPSNSANLLADDICAITSYGGNRIGVVWSDQVVNAYRFSFHVDGAVDTVWSAIETVFAGETDDHLDLATHSDGRVFLAGKNAANNLLLYVRATSGTWTRFVVTQPAPILTRPIVVLDEQAGILHVFATGQDTGEVFEKTSPVGSINFGAGTGTIRMRDQVPLFRISNPTSTKQTVNSSTGLVVLAHHDTTGMYWHHEVAPAVVDPDGDGDGVSNLADNCPTVPNANQANGDADTLGDLCDNCPAVANQTQINGDADTLGDACDNCPAVANQTQVNTDGDTIGDACDNCLTVANQTQVNGDADMLGDACDNCPTVANQNQVNGDADMVGDACDNCPAVANQTQVNGDADMLGDACDNCPMVANQTQVNTDGDTIGDACDNCVLLTNQDQANGDGDQFGNGCDNCPAIANNNQLDGDGDLLGNACDNCPVIANPGQANVDLDTRGDVCDNCPMVANNDQFDDDSDNIGNACDDDDDNDSIVDTLDNCPLVNNTDQANGDGDAFGNLCDNCPTTANDGQANGDADAFGDACDNCITVANTSQADGDNDLVGTACDNCPTAANQDQANNDADLIGDACDNCPMSANQSQANDDADMLGDVCDNCPTAANQDQVNGDADDFGDACDNCPALANVNQADNDGDAQGDVCDEDDDNDTIADVSDNCPFFANTIQVDADTDNIGDACDNCPAIANSTQLNGDADTLGDACDNCPMVANQGQADGDTDTRGDACDNCVAVANQDQANGDGDNLGNVCDNCPSAANNSQVNGDGDTFGNACDNCTAITNQDQADGDADNVGNVCDNCPVAANSSQANDDSDALGNACDNCPTSTNTSQANNDGDAQGDACDSDDDNDTVADTTDNCPLLANASQINGDSDSLGNACDNCPAVANQNQADGDADTAGDACDNCPAFVNSTQANADGDTFGNACDNCPTITNQTQVDADTDTVGNVCDNCPNFANLNQDNEDGDGQGDACDSDDDNDTVTDAADNCPLVANTNQADDDGDGIGDVCENQVPVPLSLKTIKVQRLLPSNLKDAVANPMAAKLLGKVLFWDMQVGSDGMACASCHFRAGQDPRLTNQVNPGSMDAFGTFFSGSGGPNYTPKSCDFPFHRLAVPDDNDSDVLHDTDDRLSSAGVFHRSFTNVNPGDPDDSGTIQADPDGFSVGGVNVRRVDLRNTPTVINSIFLHRTGFDGSGNFYFNGTNPFGDTDPDARILINDRAAGNTAKLVRLLFDHGATASWAVGPPLSAFDMSFDGRTFPELGRKLLSLPPLALQRVALDDSLLGPVSAFPAAGLTGATYSDLIEAAFHPRLWNGGGLYDGYTHKEKNFSLYFGLAILCYEATLVSDDSPFDQYQDGGGEGGTESDALTAQQKEGLDVFMGRGACIQCHAGSEFAGATHTQIALEGPLERRLTAEGLAAGSLILVSDPPPIGEPLHVSDASLDFDPRGLLIEIRPPSGAGAPLAFGWGYFSTGNGACNPAIDQRIVLTPGNNAPQYSRFAAEMRLRVDLDCSMVFRIDMSWQYPGLPGGNYKLYVGGQLVGVIAMEQVQPPAVFDNGFYNIGLRPTADDLGDGGSGPFGPFAFAARARNGENVDGGLLQPPVGPTERIAVDGAFKVPSLRNIELTGPYGHMGGFSTLEQVVDFYTGGAHFAAANRANLAPEVLGITGMDPTRKAALVAFLKSLTDERVRFERAPFDHPELFVPNGHPGDETLVTAGPNCNGAVCEATEATLHVPPVGAGGVAAGSELQPFEDQLEPCVMMLASAGSEVTETGIGFAQVRVALTRRPAADVTVPLVVSDSTEGIVSTAATLVFTQANWSTPQLAVVRGVQDGIADGSQAFTLEVGGVTSADPDFAGVMGDSVQITSIDSGVLYQTFAYEAENGSLSSPMVQVIDGTASNGRYVWVPNGTGNNTSTSGTSGSTAFTFSVTAPGNYYVWALVQAPTSNDNQFWAKMDTGTSHNWTLPVTSAWTWDKVNNSGSQDPVYWILTAGTHTLRLRWREDGTALDRVIVTSDPAYVP